MYYNYQKITSNASEVLRNDSRHFFNSTLIHAWVHSVSVGPVFFCKCTNIVPRTAKTTLTHSGQLAPT